MRNTRNTQTIKHESDLPLSKGYVLMLDVLGFREYITRTGMSKFLDFWMKLKSDVMRTCSNLDDNDEYSLAKFDIMFLSDTIVICLSSKQGATIRPEKLIGFVAVILESIFISSFKQGVFFRGAISFGDFFCDSKNNIAMGAAITEAYEWHESTEWIGIILAPSAKYTIERIIMLAPIGGYLDKEIKNSFILYKPPFKNNLTFETFVFKWIDEIGDIVSDGLELSSILEVLSDLSYPVSVIRKYENTMIFIGHILNIDMEKFRSENTRMQMDFHKLSTTDNS